MRVDAIKDESDEALKAIGLHPKEDPCGEDGHHTEEPFTSEDEKVAELAYYLGTIFDYGHECPDCPCMKTSSIELWKRIARALRVHGLKIIDIPRPSQPAISDLAINHFDRWLSGEL
jgi:hypothetical protein